MPSRIGKTRPQAVHVNVCAVSSYRSGAWCVSGQARISSNCVSKDTGSPPARGSALRRRPPQLAGAHDRRSVTSSRSVRDAAADDPAVRRRSSGAFREVEGPRTHGNGLGRWSASAATDLTYLLRSGGPRPARNLTSAIPFEPRQQEAMVTGSNRRGYIPAPERSRFRKIL